MAAPSPAAAIRSSFEAEVLRRLHKRIDEVRIANMSDLANGNALVPNDLVATGGNYYSATGYLRALTHVLEWAEEVERDVIRGK